MSKRIGFDSARLQTINPGAYGHLPKSALNGNLIYYYTALGDLRATDNSITYAYLKGEYNVSRKRFNYSWVDVSDKVGGSR